MSNSELTICEYVHIETMSKLEHIEPGTLLKNIKWAREVTDLARNVYVVFELRIFKTPKTIFGNFLNL